MAEKPKLSKQDLYVYKAKNSQGIVMTGEIPAASLVQAKAILRKQGLITQSVTKKRESFFKNRTKKIKSKDVTFLLAKWPLC